MENSSGKISEGDLVIKDGFYLKVIINQSRSGVEFCCADLSYLNGRPYSYEWVKEHRVKPAGKTALQKRIAENSDKIKKLKGNIDFLQGLLDKLK